MRKRTLAGVFAVMAFVGASLLTSTPASATLGDDCAGESGTHPIDGGSTRQVMGSYKGKDWQFLLCLQEDSGEPFANYVLARIKYDEAGTINQNINGENVVKAIEVDYLSLYESGNFVAACDGESGNRFDGGGCNDVVWNDDTTHLDTGPCQGFHNVATHGTAQGSSGCDPSRTTNFSQTDKYRDPIGSQGYEGIVKFRVKYYDNTVSNWWTKTVIGYA
jgi:hypothetical protein